MGFKRITFMISVALLGCFMTSSLFGATINVPNRPVPPPATVAVIKDNNINYSTMVSQALEAALGAGGITNLVHIGNTVLIKPNLVSNKALAVTDWHVVRALVDLIKVANGGASIIIAEGSASNATSNTRVIMAAQGYTTANFPDVTLFDLNDITACPTNTFVLADGMTGTNKQVAQIIYDADVYIDLPKMKTHYHAGFTGAVKNLGIGTAPWPLWNNVGLNTNKGGLHHDIRREIVDHILCRVPDLTVMDAIQCMEGQGPASGTAVTMNLVLASKDPVALDAVACAIMGIPTYLINHLVLAANENVGVIDMDKITVTGNSTIAAVQRNFTRATPGAATAPSEPGVIPYRATTVIRPAPQNLVVDGNLGEWGYANLLKADELYQVKGTSTGWSGSSDCSFKSQFLYDASNLYLAMTVRDDNKLPNTNSGSAITSGECIELYLSTFPSQYDSTHGRTYLSQYDYRLGISYAETPRTWILSHNQAPSGVIVSKVETIDGYIIEASIPWSNFANFSLSRYRELGINLALDDADNSASTVDDKIMLANAKDADIETNPFKLGVGYLDPAGGIYDIPSYSLSIASINGTVTKNPDQSSYTANSVVNLTATPNTDYIFSGWSGDATGMTNPLSVTMNGNKNITANFTSQVLTSIVITPSSVSVNSSSTQLFTASALDQNNNPLSTQPSFTWNVSGGGVIDQYGLFTAGISTGGPYTITATSGDVSGTASVTVVLFNAAPTIATAASVSPSPVTGATAAFSVLGADDNGESNLTYTWATSGTVPAAVTFSANGTNAAKATIATFTAAGTYVFQVTVKDAGNLTITSTVTVTVNQTLTSIVVSPATASLATSASQQFSAIARDQFATSLTTQPTFTWSASSAGTISTSGLFTAGITAGSGTVSAVSGTVTGTASVTVTAAPATVYQINCGSTSAVAPFKVDQYYTGGTARTVTNTITLTGVTNPAPQAVYQTERYGTVTYTFPSLTASAQYAVRLHFAELYQTATGKRVFNVLINGTSVLPNFDIYAVAGAAYKAVVREFTATANASGQIVINLNTVTDNATIQGIEIIQMTPNAAPTIATTASASPSPVTAKTAALSVLGADDNGESGLTYTWATTGTPPAAVTFSANGTNAAKATTATFTVAGTYVFQVTVKDAGNLTTTSTVTVTVNQTLTSVVLSPASASIATSATQQFSATARDQFATSLITQPTFTWSVSGAGTISTDGLFSAGITSGSATVSATSGAIAGTASVTVTQPNAAPTISTAASASPSPVTAATAALSVLGADDNGESNLIYTWATSGTVPAAVTFSANGTNAAKATTATFSKAGSYTFLVTIRDAGNLTVTSTVTVTVNQTLTSIVLSPASASIATSATQQFSATARDQFATSLTTQPTFTWSVSGAGLMSSSGLFTAGTVAGSGTVSAVSGTVTGTASVTVTSVSAAAYQINCGSTSAVSPFKVDQYYTGGTALSVTNTITLTGVTNPAPQAVYQTERYGTSTYTFPSLTASAQYTVRLHFAELYQTATGKRVFNVLINGTTVLPNFDIYAAAGAQYKAIVREFTATANASGQIVIKFNTVTDNATIQGIEIIQTTSNAAPTISTAASVSPNPLTAATAALSALGADDNGESGLTYTWATSGTVPAAVTFSANGTNAAKATTATFTKAGSYTFLVTVKDAGNLTVTSTVNVTVNQVLTSIVLSPASASIATSASQQFSATARDQFATNLTTQPTFIWNASGAGLISSSGLFTAGITAGSATVSATSATITGTASVTVTQPNAAPTISTAASASPSPVSAATAALSVLGADDNGESILTYTWATSGTVPAAVTFSANGTNAAKATTATFTKAGSYTFLVTVKDAGNLTVTSTVNVTVNQVLTSIVLSPASASIATSASQQFSATARDQFAINLTTQPTFTWSISGGGTISTTGLFTAGVTAGSTTVSAVSGTVTGTASVTVTATSTTVYQINCGSTSVVSPFKVDQYYTGGTTRTVTNAITLTGVTNAAPQAVYQTERYGTTTYTIPSLTASAQYTVRLHFAELYQTATGKRVFNVLINGTTVLSNFDIYAATGARYKAVVREFTATANASGQIVIKFNTVTDNATVQGIEIIKK